jgi:type I restriction enzyme S subunit
MEGRELPVGWVEAQAGEVCRLLNGRAYSKSELLDSGKYRILRVGNLFTNPHWYHSDLELDEDKYCQAGDLLYAWSASFGPHVWKGERVIYHYHIWKVEHDEDLIHRDFLKVFFLWDTNRIKQQKGSGSTMLHVTKKSMEERAIPLPPLNEQRRIAAKLDTTLAAVDACRQRLDGVAVILKRFRQVVLAAATSGELTREWREERGLALAPEKPLGSILKVSSGKFLPAKAMVSSGNIPVYGGNGVNGYHDRSSVDETTLVIGRVGYHCGSLHLTPDKAWITDNALIVKFNTESTRKNYLYYALQGVDLRANDSSTAQPVISGAKIYPIMLLHPSLDEQDEIIDLVEILFTLANQLETRLTAARKIVDRLTPALLAKAFRGELVPQDPNDEPASILLERIRAARQAEATAAKPSRRGRPKAAANPEPIALEAAPVSADFLTRLLRECGALSERALLAASELEPQQFQRQLKKELERGIARAVQGDGQVLLEAVG